MEKLYYTFIDLDNKIFNYSDFPSIRKDYLNTITDLTKKNQSYYVWKLLNFALNQSGITQNIDFGCENGRFFIKDSNYYFSLTHTHNLVAVLLSEIPCGIDAEKITEKSFKLEKRYKNVINCTVYDTLSDSCKMTELTKLWCKEECLFKANNNNLKTTTTIIQNKQDEFVVCYTSNSPLEQIHLNKII